MGYVIAVYTKEAFKEFLLPSTNNADYDLVLHKDEFLLRDDLHIQFEVMDNIWRICPGKQYRLFSEQEIKSPCKINGTSIFRVVASSGEKISLMVRTMINPFPAYQKYDISGLNTITIGKNPDNLICYNYRGMISGLHAVLRKSGSRWIIESKGQNGVYVNSSIVIGEMPLSFGDFINIIGLHAVFLGNCLAIDVSREEMLIRTDILQPMELEVNSDDMSTADDERPVFSDKILYHRAPRVIEKIETEQIEIEAPPSLQKSRKQPVLMTIGPSFTMAIPMLLGCLLMIYSSQRSGGTNGLYMYSGLIMAVSSALLGVVWALVNIRFQKKTEKEEQNHRFDAYSKYLLAKTDEVRTKYEDNTQALLKMYPEAAVCAGYDENSSMLWNRNATHDDFLSCRLGLGEQDFQVPIIVPKKKFSLETDALAEKPNLILDNYKKLYNVPILLNLKEHPMIGLTGGDDKRGAIDVARLISTQIAATHCYTDVKMVYLYDQNNSSDNGAWDFAKWLPHVWSEDRKMRYVACDKQSVSDVCYELTKIFRYRLEEQSVDSTGYYKPWFVVFLSDVSLIEDELLAKYIFDGPEKVGMTTIILSDTSDNLPNSCEYIVQNDSYGTCMYNVSMQKEERIDIKFDSISCESLDQMARKLNNIEVQEMETGGEIPNSLTFFEMYGVERPEELKADERWAKNRNYENIKGLIGQKAGAAPCYMDVHEKYHGPHGLVAGTTGSGKSETLQTYMLSLAVNYSPDDIGFFIIDYKGGGMANLFNGLPHMVGQISNLSGNQVHRAMVSIKSENRRRQRIFNEHGVNNINLYTRLYKSGEAAEAIPHLFIIIDEFAELKKEEPDFMKELISVAQVGRSLGVHLILATQKPSGTVDDNIWSNSKFRLCLRVQDRDDSMDMLHKPDAAYITQAGRCYLQVGSDEVYELFQSGWSGAPYDEHLETGKTELVRLIDITGRPQITGGHAKAARKEQVLRRWLGDLIGCIKNALKDNNTPSLDQAIHERNMMHSLIMRVFDKIEEQGIDYPRGTYNEARIEELIGLYGRQQSAGGDVVGRIIKEAAASNIKLPMEKEKTQLDAVKDYLAQIARIHGYQKKHQLWMPVLEERIYLNSFEEFRRSGFNDGHWQEHAGEWSLDTIVGLMDDPRNQTQMPMHLSFSEGGHHAVIGSVVSGKSTFVQTTVFGLVSRYTPEEINIYALDFSSKMMSAFEQLPHIGGVIYEGEDEKLAKFFNMIEKMLEERKKLFRGGNYSQYVKVHGIVIPAIVLIVDNFSAFKEKTEDKYEQMMITLAKEGVSHGIYLLLTAGGFGMSEIPNRIAENLKTVICLQLPDKYAYSDVLHTLQLDVMPEVGVKGRGLAYYDSRILEFQTALALDATDDYQRMEEITRICTKMRSSWKGWSAKAIPEIPEKPVWTEFSVLDDVVRMSEERDLLPVAYNEKNAEIYGINLRKIYCYLITGLAHSGKKNFMKIMIQSARMKKAKVYLLDGGNSMNIFADEPDVNLIKTADELFDFFINELTPVFKERNERKHELDLQGAEEDELYESSAATEPIFIFVPEMRWFIDTIYTDTRGMSPFMETLIKKGRYHNIYFVAAMSLENRSQVSGYQVYEDFAGYHTGIHFGGNTAMNSLMTFDYLSFAEQSKTLKPGVGLIPDGNDEPDVEKIIVPLAKWRKKSIS